MNAIFKKTLPLMMSAALLTSCSSTATDSTTQAGTTTAPSQAEKLKIITTTFPEYDWVREIVGEHIDHIELVQLIDNGVDLHSYTPTANDIIEIGTADLFLYNGGISTEAWMDGVLDQKTNEDMVIVNLLEHLGEAVLEEDHFHYDDVEVTDDHDHDHDHAEETTDDHDHDHGHDDEHFWMSLNHAKSLSVLIAEKLGEVDPDNADDYTANVAAYVQKLTDLDTQYQEMVDGAARKVILVADRFPFAYLAYDYDLEYHAAFSGCSAETEASFGTIVFLSEKAGELALPYILTTETGHEIAQTVANQAQNQEILALDSMQSTTSQSGDTYLSIMEANLAVLTTVLN